ncbi:hypothetical protein AC578_2858 [Pseudocercospora eumusae]|uniref:Uncharacterized protein n=1 Tax=Pseudocercospora eumusae TaxID=321146 RepID=A0A139H3U6_9PEZI|nr:hypothetical protein AC578_2858 [Pseudocercospora eumusae]
MLCLRQHFLAALLAAFGLTQIAASGPTSSNATAPVPIALGGKEADISEDFIRLMLPEYDVVHVVNSAPNGIYEFPPLVTGEYSIPVSGLGSNVNSPSPKVPKAIFVGGGFSQWEINKMYYTYAEVQAVPWLYPPTTARANGTVIPSTEVIVARVKQVFAQYGLVPGNDTDPAPGIWSF